MAKLTANKLKKIKEQIEKTYDTGKLPINMSLSDFRTTEYIFYLLCDNKQFSTCQKNVKTFYEQNNVPVLDKGYTYIIG